MHRTSKHPSVVSTTRNHTIADKEIRDRSQVAAIYRSCHRAAEQHAPHITVKLTLESYDAIEAAAQFYHEHKILLPGKVKLRLYFFDNDLNTSVLFSEIHGAGARDKNYDVSIAHMLMLAKLGQPNADAEIVNVAKDMDAQEFIAYRAAVSGESTLAVMMDADGCFYGYKEYMLLKQIKYLHGTDIELAIKQIRQKDADFDASLLIANIQRTIIESPVEQWNKQDDKLLPCEETVPNEALAELREQLHMISPQLISDVHYRVHEKLVARILQDADARQCQAVVFMFGTSRQSHGLDLTNAKNYFTGCFMRDLQAFTRDLNQRLHGRTRFCLDRFLLADAYNNLEQGTSFMQIYHNEHKSHPHPKAIFDASKASVVYACAQHAKRKYPGINHMVFFEDIEDIAAKLLHHFNHQYTAMIPRGLVIDIIMYDSDFIKSGNNAAITGTGTIDKHLNYSIQLMGCHAQNNESLAEAMMRPGKDFIARGALRKLMEDRAARQQQSISLYGVLFSSKEYVEMHFEVSSGNVRRFH